MKRLFSTVAVLGLLLTVSSVAADDAKEVPSAKQVIATVAAYKPQAADKPAENPVNAWGTALRELMKSVDKLPPDQAASKWLELFDKRLEIWKTNPESKHALSFHLLFLALPGPESWPAIKKAAEAKQTRDGIEGLQNVGLSLLISKLDGDHEDLLKNIQAMQAKAEQLPLWQKGQVVNTLEKIKESANPQNADLLKQFEASLDKIESGIAGTQNEFRLPDLISLAGEQKAQELLARALKTHAILAFHNDAKNMRLAASVTLKNIDTLKRPQWNAVWGPDAVELFEKIQAKFPPSKASNKSGGRGFLGLMMDSGSVVEEDSALTYGRENATAVYVIGLISRNRTADAVTFVKKNKDSRLLMSRTRDLSRLGLKVDPVQLFEFYDLLLADNPKLQFWYDYINAAEQADKTQEAIARVRSIIDDKKTDQETQRQLADILRSLLLTSGQVDEAMALYQQEIKKLLAKQADKSSSPRIMYGYSQGQYELGGLIAGYLMVNELTNNQEGQRQAVNFAKEFLEKKSQPYDQALVLELVINHYLKNQQYADAVELLSRRLEQSVHPVGSKASTFSFENRYTQESILAMLTLLAQTYHNAGRPQDVVQLLQDAPWWGTPDLVQLTMNQISRYSPYATSNPSIGLIAASSLAQTDQTEPAGKIVHAMLDREPGNDDCYAQLLKIDPDGAMAKLESMFKLDPFEERPLIWKAKLLLEQKKVDEAEKTILRAIAIDPSDGEQGKDRRMLAYAVLRDIKKAQGDEKQAAFFESVVQAIRMAEQADSFYAAGMRLRALEMYKQSLTLFADAYCIQSRLAVQLAQAGRFEEAAAYYQKAFELMPDSFGRVESHCFGCENIFAGEQAQTIAEKTFAALAEKSPDNPRVQYLIGYLRQEQGNDAEALKHYNLAVKLDPDYLNAWRKIAEISRADNNSAAASQAAALNILRLDPLSRHSNLNLNNITDFKSVWQAFDKATANRPQMPDSLFPLPASAKALKQKNPKTAPDNQAASINEIMLEIDEDIDVGDIDTQWMANGQRLYGDAKSNVRSIISQNRDIQQIQSLMNINY